VKAVVSHVEEKAELPRSEAKIPVAAPAAVVPKVLTVAKATEISAGNQPEGAADVDQLAKRAARFGIAPKEEVKKVLRAQRFGTASDATATGKESKAAIQQKKVEAAIGADPVEVAAKLKNRAERFGITTVEMKAEAEAKKLQDIVRMVLLHYSPHDV
jgi:hypothetical protein